MNALSPDERDDKLATALAKLAPIGPLIDEAAKLTESTIEPKHRFHSHALGVIKEHATRVRRHSGAMAKWLTDLPPVLGQLLAESYSPGVGDPPKAANIVESDDAYDRDKLDTLNSRDIRDAIEFNTEFKDSFGFAWIDDEIRTPLTDALDKLLVLLEGGNATVPGMVVQVLKVLIKGHPRAFGRYYSGKDPWPRPSAVIQAEIDYRMPDALWWLRQELADALEQEAAAAAPANAHGGDHER